MASSSFKKRQEEAQKKQNGEMAPDVDQDGKMINPHNPDFITKVPWYLGNNTGPTLKHHQQQQQLHELSLTETDQLIAEKVRNQQRLLQSTNRIVYRKGSCKNCGAMTHQAKDCIERPRSAKMAAWKSGIDIAPDESVMHLSDFGKLSYDAKRDQYQGYDAAQYKQVVDRFERLEEEQRKAKQEQKLKELEEKRLAALEKKAAKKSRKQGSGDKISATVTKTTTTEGDQESSNTENSDSGSDSDSDSDSDDEDDDDNNEDLAKDFIQKDEQARDFQTRIARQGGVMGAQMKITSRNLRIREDTPKYLRNLNLDSAHYDPKSRSMRANPFPGENPEDLPFAGDNFIRYSGDAIKLAQTQVLCWDMQGKSSVDVSSSDAAVDVIANPSQAEFMHKKITQERAVQMSETKKAILDKYGVDSNSGSSGGGAALDARLRLGQSEAYSEYSWDGRVIKGAGKFIPKSKYEEDVFLNNHTSVWGSYYCRARCCWGYACCHSLIRNAYCTGEAGKEANDNANSGSMDPSQVRQMLQNREQLAQKRKAAPIAKRSDLYGDGDSSVAATDLDASALQEALKREQEFRARDASSELNDRTRNYNSMKTIDVQKEDMEAYRLKKVRKDDPMAAFMDKDS